VWSDRAISPVGRYDLGTIPPPPMEYYGWQRFATNIPENRLFSAVFTGDNY